jgi:hypothetical protein
MAPIRIVLKSNGDIDYIDATKKEMIDKVYEVFGEESGISGSMIVEEDCQDRLVEDYISCTWAAINKSHIGHKLIEEIWSYTPNKKPEELDEHMFIKILEGYNIQVSHDTIKKEGWKKINKDEYDNMRAAVKIL